LCIFIRLRTSNNPSSFYNPRIIVLSKVIWDCSVCCWYRHVLWKDDDWVKKCMEYEVEGPRPRWRPKRTRREVVWEDCKTRKLNKVDAMDRCKWRKVLKAVRWSGWVSGWVFLLVPAYPGSPGPKAVKRLLLLLLHNYLYLLTYLLAEMGGQ